MANEVSLKRGLYADYVSLDPKDSDTLYFCTDTRQIFLGSISYSPFPQCPTGTDGTYVLRGIVSNGSVTYQWGTTGETYDGTIVVGDGNGE